METIVSKEPIITFEEFTKQCGNFSLFFAESMSGEIQRKWRVFKDTYDSNDNFKSLFDKLLGKNFVEFDIDEHGKMIPLDVDINDLKLLYEAYTMMYNHPLVKRYGDLFKKDL